MRRKYPTAGKIKFLVCEQARPEVNNKLSLLGLYPSDKIVFFPEKVGEFPYTLGSLALVFFFQDGCGEFDANVVIAAPNGDINLSSKLNKVKLKSDTGGGLIVTGGPMQFHAEGQYVVSLKIGNKKYEFPLSISGASRPKGD